MTVIRRQGKLRIVEREDKARAIQRRYFLRWRLINFGPFGPYSWGPIGSHVWLSEKFYLDTSLFNILEDRWNEAIRFTAWIILYPSK